MKKIIFVLTLFTAFFIGNFNINSADFTKIDDFWIDGKYKEGLDFSLKQIDAAKVDLELIWRISRFYLEIGDETTVKKDKIDIYTKGMDIAQPYLETATGDNLLKAEVLFWYTANLGSRSKAIGIFESIDTLPKLFELTDKTIKLDPTFAPPYLLKGKIDSEVPSFLGGDSFRMGVSFTEAIKYNSKDMTVLADSADGFYSRNWDINKKSKEKEKRNKSDGSPDTMTDKQYAKELGNQAVALYKSLTRPSKRDTTKYNEVLQLLKKL